MAATSLVDLPLSVHPLHIYVSGRTLKGSYKHPIPCLQAHVSPDQPTSDYKLFTSSDQAVKPYRQPAYLHKRYVNPIKHAEPEKHHKSLSTRAGNRDGGDHLEQPGRACDIRGRKFKGRRWSAYAYLDCIYTRRAFGSAQISLCYSSKRTGRRIPSQLLKATHVRLFSLCLAHSRRTEHMSRSSP